MLRRILRPSALVSLALHGGAFAGALVLGGARGPADHGAVVLAFETVELGSAEDAPESPSADPTPPDELRLEPPTDVEPRVDEPPLPEEPLPLLDEPVRPARAPAPLPAPSPTARTRPAPGVPAPAVLPAPTPASVASRAGAAQVSTLARARPTNRPPAYPDAAVRAGWEGVVWLIVDVGPDGRVAAVALERSSGHEVLDAAALAAVASWTYEPRIADGVPTLDRLRLPVRFSMRAPAGLGAAR